MPTVFEVLESHDPNQIDALIREVFDKADQNHNGVIEPNELMDFMIFFSNKLNLGLPS